MLFDAGDAAADGAPGTHATAGVVPGVDARRWRLRCRGCGHVLAAPAWRVQIDGRERHERTNPLGLRFALRLYAAAPGCRGSGAPSAAHSWFPPCAWQVLVCGGCGEHRGWRFDGAATSGFVALIIEAIVEEAYE